MPSSLTRKVRLERGPWRKRLSSDPRKRAQQVRGDMPTAERVAGSRKDLEDTLEKLNARCLKMEHHFQCQQCAEDGLPNQGILDAGHIYPKGQFPGGKFLYENLIPQCRYHNELHIGQPHFLFDFYQEKHGPEALEKLHQKVLAMPRRMSIEWLVEQIAEREQAISALECHLAAMV
ncbi:MAG TPA: hypothetical protein VJS44_08135 [Pyrinomonadaceae bacterium]|nr:hypothetical protein [Pyrinomonadaceae bacterium]